MTESSGEFAESLLKAIRAGRSFGGHSLWFRQFFDGLDREVGHDYR